MRWTEEQDDVLREVSFHGTAFAAAEIARRERDRLRQRNSRLCRKYGLKSRRERKKRRPDEYAALNVSHDGRSLRWAFVTS